MKRFVSGSCGGHIHSARIVIVPAECLGYIIVLCCPSVTFFFIFAPSTEANVSPLPRGGSSCLLTAWAERIVRISLTLGREDFKDAFPFPRLSLLLRFSERSTYSHGDGVVTDSHGVDPCRHCGAVRLSNHLIRFAPAA